MRIVLQRVKKAQVKVGGETVGKIADGFVVLLAIKKGDTSKDADWLVQKILNLRLFGDDKTFMKESVLQRKGEILVVSQFTLLGNLKKGTRPDFSESAESAIANNLYEYFVQRLKQSQIGVSTGIFAKHMEVSLVNDGPVTLVVDSP